MHDFSSGRGRRRTVVLAGASGLVGQAILQQLLTDTTVTTVHAIGRHKPDIEHPKLNSHVVDFTALPPFLTVDEVYLALGTTIKVAGSQSAFRAVDFQATLAVAQAALAAGVRRAGLVSAMGANAKSRFFYNRVKGETEDALAVLPFDGLVIARPSLLIGDRQILGQPKRPLEEAGMAVSKFLGPLMPANYQPIAASKVARALVGLVPVVQGRVILHSGDMRR
jgi:uncharacterized protein YbjT (DUF2867 family)